MTAAGAPAARHFTIRQAAFIGVGAMVGAGIFSLLGAAGEVAGAAVWLSFVLAGIIAMLQGYSFAKFGAKYPSAGGMLEYVSRGFGEGHVTGVTAWLVYSANTIVTAMVAVSFGSYASSLFANENAVWAKIFAVAIVLVMTVVNLVGARVVAKAQSVIVFVVIGSLLLFAIVTIVNMDPSLLAPSGYPSFTDIVSSVALTFFAFLGFGIITFTAKDLAEPSRELPRAMFLRSRDRDGHLHRHRAGCVRHAHRRTGDRVRSLPRSPSPPSPSLGRAGYWLMGVIALFATAGATNAGLYPAAGLSEHLAASGEFPPLMGKRYDDRFPVGLLIVTVACVVLVLGFDLSAIASIGSAVALLIFAFITAAHFRVYRETGANLWILILAIVATTAVVLDVHLHDPHPRARLDVDPARDPGAEHPARPRLEAAPRRERTGGRPDTSRRHKGSPHDRHARRRRHDRLVHPLRGGRCGTAGRRPGPGAGRRRGAAAAGSSTGRTSCRPSRRRASGRSRGASCPTR